MRPRGRSTLRSCQKLISCRRVHSASACCSDSGIVHAVQVQQQAADRVGRAAAVVEQRRAVGVARGLRTSCSKASSRSCSSALGQRVIARRRRASGANTRRPASRCGGCTRRAAEAGAGSAQRGARSRQVGEPMRRRAASPSSAMSSAVRAKAVDGAHRRAQAGRAQPATRPGSSRSDRRPRRSAHCPCGASRCSDRCLTAHWVRRTYITDQSVINESTRTSRRLAMTVSQTTVCAMKRPAPLAAAASARPGRLLASRAPPAEPIRASAHDHAGHAAASAASTNTPAEVRARTESRLGFACRRQAAVAHRPTWATPCVPGERAGAARPRRPEARARRPRRPALGAAQASYEFSGGRLQALQGAAGPGLHQRLGARAQRDRAAQAAQAQLRAGARAGQRAGQPDAVCHAGGRRIGVITAVDAEPGAVVAAGAAGGAPRARRAARRGVQRCRRTASPSCAPLAGKAGRVEGARLGRRSATAAGHGARGGRRGRPGDAHLHRQGRRRHAPTCASGRRPACKIEMPQTWLARSKLPLAAVFEARAQHRRLGGRQVPA